VARRTRPPAHILKLDALDAHKALDDVIERRRTWDNLRRA
jgi:hypothetical protein